MKFNALGLFICFWIYDLISDPLKELIRTGQVSDYFYAFESLNKFIVFVSSNLSFLMFAFMSYAAFYFFFPKKKWAYLILSLIMTAVIPIVVRFLLEQVLYHHLFDYTNYPLHTTLGTFARDNYYYATRYIIYGTTFYLITYALFRERQEKGLIIENQKMELSLLRAQINPHFLLNSLNNIYSLIYKNSDQSLQAVEELSGVLKYSLYEKKEAVPLKREMEIVDKMIDLNKIRYSYPLAIRKNIQAGIGHHKVPPFLIIPLIENAFKHGDLKDQNTPLNISIKKEKDTIHVEVTNKKGQQKKDKLGGIGLENIRKRLKLIYPKNHEFLINDEDSFQVTIKIPAA